jgi:hypothetical protein
MYMFGYSFTLKGFMRDVFHYYNLTPAHLHPNRWATVSVFDKLLGILKMELTINIFRHHFMLINRDDEGPFIPWFFTFSTRLRGL